jgi:riboflavin kinase/FMN adenylyltransferase
MKINRDLLGGPLCSASVLTIGAFDGLHLGHQAMLSSVVARAGELGVASAVVSFEPLPRSYFKQPGLLRILSVHKKLALLQASGIDHLLMLRFNQALAAMSPEAFIERVLVQRLRAVEVWIGADFRFGAKRAGSIETLRTQGARFGFSVQEFAEVQCAGERISASAVRAALLDGDFIGVQRRLGRPFRYRARVQTGQQLGRTLGFPTANLPWPNDNPLRGIFTVRVSGAKLHRHPAVASLGTRPVVNGVEPLLEVHLLDFSGDLYGQVLTIEFIAKQREEWNFPNLAALVEQIKLDELQARQILASNP